MTIETTAALVWRFIGLFAVVTAVPGIVVIMRLPFPALATVMVLAQIIIGLLLLLYSRALGRLITRGL